MQDLSAAWLYPIILVAGALQAWGPPRAQSALTIFGPTLISLTGRILRRGPCDAEIGNHKAAPYS